MIRQAVEGLRRRLGASGHDVFWNTLTLMVGSLGARVVGAATIVIVARLYAPTDFGVLAVFTATVSLLAPFSTLQYSTALPLPRSSAAAANLWALAAGLIAASTILLTGVLFFFGDGLLTLISAEALGPFRPLIVIGFLGASFYTLMSDWAIRQKAFVAISKTLVKQVILGSIAKIGLALLGFHSTGLLLGQIVQKTAGVASLLGEGENRITKKVKHISVLRMVATAKKYRTFPKFRLPSQALLAFSMQAPTLFVAAAYDASITGQFGIAMALIALPISLLSSTAGRAYYGEVARIGKSNATKIRAVTRDLFWKMLLIAMVPSIALYALAPMIVPIMLGSEWDLAGHFARYLAIYIPFLFVSQPIVQVLTVFEMNGAFLFLNGLRGVLIVAIFSAALLLDLSPVDAVATYSIAMAGYYLAMGIFTLNIINRRSKESISR